jgi:hypothetical protein
MRYKAVTTPRASEPPRHLGIGPCFVEKHKPPIVESGTPEQPTSASICDIGPLLFSRMQHFF